MELAGRGGMGEVYRARDTRLDRNVAIKFLTPALADNPKGRERFEREARAISKLAHPHICTLLDIGSGIVRGVDARYLVMEFVEGETLAARLRRGPLPAAEAIATGAQIADALAAAHAVGVIHRDLKPGNIMLTRSGAKLLDFGLARFAADGAGATAGAASSNEPLTKDGAIVGTLAYMAPEQLRGNDVDARSDVFSFGAVLYEMLSSTRAFDGSSNADIIAAVLERQPPSLAERHPLTPRAVDRRGLDVPGEGPNDRWQSSRDLQRELRWLLEDKHSRLEPPVRVNRARPRMDIQLGRRNGGALVLAAAVYALSFSRQAPHSATHHVLRAGAGGQHLLARHGANVDLARWQHAGVCRADQRRHPAALDSPLQCARAVGARWTRSTRCCRSGRRIAGRSASLPRTSSSGSMSMAVARRELSPVVHSAWRRVEPRRHDSVRIEFRAAACRRYRWRSDAGDCRWTQARTDRAHAWPQFLPDGQQVLVPGDRQ